MKSLWIQGYWIFHTENLSVLGSDEVMTKIRRRGKKFNYQPYFQSNGIQINSLLVYNSDTDFKLLQNAIYYFLHF
jgi:hypothetical protein